MEQNKKYGFCEAALFCGMARSTFKGWVKEGKVKHEVVKSMKQDFLVFSEVDLLEFLAWRDSIISRMEISEKYNLSESLIRKSISNGYLPAKRYLRFVYCKKSDVEKWLKKRANGLIHTRTYKPKAVPVQSIEQINKPTLEELITKLTSVLEGLL